MKAQAYIDQDIGAKSHAKCDVDAVIIPRHNSAFIANSTLNACCSVHNLFSSLRCEANLTGARELARIEAEEEFQIRLTASS
jgi:hypothetical protein